MAAFLIGGIRRFTMTAIRALALAATLAIPPATPAAAQHGPDRGHYDRGHDDRGHYDRGHYDRGRYDRGHDDRGRYDRGHDDRDRGHGGNGGAVVGGALLGLGIGALIGGAIASAPPAYAAPPPVYYAPPPVYGGPPPPPAYYGY
jgi:hypothetical protein